MQTPHRRSQENRTHHRRLSGFSLQTALFFLDKGWSAVATTRTPREGLFTARVRLRVLALALDTTDPDSIAAAMEAAGPIGVLVNNAGVGMLSAVAGTDMAGARETYETNTLGTVVMTKEALPGFRRRRSGVLVSIDSGTTLAPFPLLFFLHRQ
ncbi:MAG: SDR family NAD(P)-dependent oxidoreductase [Rhodobacteraceae bacterium]|nr:SDR family NAD(P)-dependent oxidoreductase [Paracoccaceae bacterium]